MSDGQSSFADAAIAIAIRVAGAGLVFAMQVVLARLMPADYYGGFVTLWSWILALGSFAALGFAESSVRFLPRYQLRDKRVKLFGYWRFGLRLVGGVSVALGVAGVALGMGLGPQGGAGLVIILVALGLPFIALEYFIEGVARSFGWFRLAAVPVYVVRPLLVIGAVLLLDGGGVELTLPVVGGVFITAMAVISGSLALVVGQRVRRLGVAGAVSARQKRVWLTASFPLLVLSGLEDLTGYADVLMLALLAGPEEVAVYFAAARCLALGGFVAYAMTLVAGRRYALDFAGASNDQLQRSISRGTMLTVGLTTAAVAVTIIAAPLLLRAFGEAYEAGWPLVAVLGAGMVAKSLSGQAQEALIVLGKQRTGIVVNLVSVTASVVLIAALTPQFGLIGAAAGAAIAMAVRSLALAIGLWRATGLMVFQRF
ncbi:oligosaccharide flippase family protein [Devosia sp. MC1541]|uniref:lipopolysaccharide biosynthesis protein n=1 Tax=Devosia sp. MC1541 TaxID=2725264 RepID=UPI00145F30B7|nr:oligosaccharide flippase family protein [Devosia sp. MC1541]